MRVTKGAISNLSTKGSTRRHSLLLFVLVHVVVEVLQQCRLLVYVLRIVAPSMGGLLFRLVVDTSGDVLELAAPRWLHDLRGVVEIHTARPIR